MDYAPRLDPGADRIAFASDRNGGDYDIFVVDWNGGGLTALTDNSSDDVAPAWSPNGNKLAFEAYRDGQAEVYVMNATGSAVTRLTNNSAYDGTPAWSPDGAKIAFTSRRTGSYQVWVMNADGTDPHALTNHLNAYDPAWSPDGSQIAFDADADGDGYEELWVMNADGTDQRQIYNPPLSNQVVYARSWSADGRYVGFSQLTWDGPITTDAIIAAWDSLIPGSIVPLSPGNRDTNPDWQATPDPDLWVSQSSSAALPGEQVDLQLDLRQSGHGRGKNRAYHRRTAGRVDLCQRRSAAQRHVTRVALEQKHPPAQQQPEPDSHHRARGSSDTTGHHPDHQRRHCIGHERAGPGQQHRDQHSHCRSDPAAELPPAGHQVDLGGHGRPPRSDSRRPRRSSVTSEV